MFASNIEIPVSIRWKLSKQQILSQLGKENWTLESEEFTVFSDIHYFLEIGHRIDEICENDIGVGLSIDIPDGTKVKAAFKISIPSANLDFECIADYEKSQAIGRIIATGEKLLDPSANYFIKDSMVILVEGVITLDEMEDASETEMEFDNPLGQKLWDRDDKDFAFIVEEKEIQVHKCVVSAESAVFDKMIKSGLKETKESKSTIIDFEFKIVEAAIKHCYGLQITQDLNIQDAIKLLQFSDKYDITGLKASMENYLSSQMTTMNVCEISNASIISNSAILRQDSFDFMVKCMRKTIFIKNLNILDKDFSFELLHASFACLSD